MINSDTADRLAKILPHLASQHDGEVVAAARAIGRTLTAAGLDWHELGRAMGGATDATVINVEPAPGTNVTSDAPSDLCGRAGMVVGGSGQIMAWSSVATRCRDLDWALPKAFGGRFLTMDERERLRWIAQHSSVTNAEAAWLECLYVHAQAAQDLWRRSGHGHPSRSAA